MENNETITTSAGTKFHNNRKKQLQLNKSKIILHILSPVSCLCLVVECNFHYHAELKISRNPIFHGILYGVVGSCSFLLLLLLLHFKFVLAKKSKNGSACKEPFSGGHGVK